jgi:hypothetical protein
VHYTRQSGRVRNCVTEYMNDEIRNLLLSSECREAVTGTYVDDSDQILVMVWVVPMADQQTAEEIYDANTYTSSSWGILCPVNGPGSEICSEDKNTSRAARGGHKRHTHRYLMQSNALYISLRQDSGAQPWLDAAAERAVKAAGPENYSGNR